MLFNNELTSIFGMLIGDVIVIARNKQTRHVPIKVLCLDGLSMEEVNDQHGYGIALNHIEECYQKCVLYFKDKQEAD